MPTKEDEMRDRIFAAMAGYEAKRKRMKDSPCPRCMVPSAEALNDLYCPACGYDWAASRRGESNGL